VSASVDFLDRLTIAKGSDVIFSFCLTRTVNLARTRLDAVITRDGQSTNLASRMSRNGVPRSTFSKK
jgi:hypothetical protein